MDIVNAWKDSAKVDAAAKRILDSEDEEVPAFFIPLLTDYMRDDPYDTEFIVEFAEKGKPGKGGNGFGTVTCMEDSCWKDIILDADPDRPNGGKDDGFGSFFNYRTHCKDPKHIEGRNKRLKKAKIPIPAAPSSSIPLPPISSQIPSQTTTTATGSVSSSITSSPLSSRDTNLLESKPRPSSISNIKGKGKAPTKGLSSDPIYISSDEDEEPPLRVLVKPNTFNLSRDTDDDDVAVLEGEDIPHQLRKETNANAPFEVSDDDEPPSHVVSMAELQAQEAAKRKKAEEDRKATSAAWMKLFNSSQELPSRSSQGLNRPPVLSSTAAGTTQNAVAGPSTVKPEPAVQSVPSAAATTIPANMPQTWWANELAYAQNRHSLRNGQVAVQPVDLTRPRLEHFIRSGRHGHPETVILAEHTQLLNLWPRLSRVKPYVTVLSKRYQGLSRWRTAPHLYEVPDINYMRILGTELEALWETKLPFRTPHQLAQGQQPLVTFSGYALELRHLAACLNEETENLEASLGLEMPGAYPERTLGMNSMGIDDSPYGYEMNRPMTEEGLSDLFKTALDDFHEDTDVETALKGLDLDRLEDKIDGLNVQLMPHQVLGVHWMLQQEKKNVNQGGILGDVMGLGKTVQAIATMVKNPSPEKKQKTTLIVLPLPLIQQWKAEIESKSDLSVYVYHGPGRTKSVNQLKAADCVLTTYSIVAIEASDLIEKPKKKTDADDVDNASRRKRKGPLFHVNWYRIILDEAAVVRNKSTKASRAVQELVGDIRWCLTGTLIYNTLSDIYPYLRFVGIIEWEEFRLRIHSLAKRKPRLACRRAQAILRRVMLRRTKDSEINGRKILQLPPKTVEMVEMDFTEEERAIYAAIETAARVKVNKWFRAGTLLKKYHMVLVMLTRLRQLCCHPWLLRASEEYRDSNVADLVEVDAEEATGESAIGVKACTDAEELARAVRDMGQEWVDKVKKKLEERYENMVQEKEGDEDDYSCAVCFEPFTDEQVTSCQHSFCATCIEGIMTSAPRDDVIADDRVRASRPCPLCRHEVDKEHLYRAKVFFQPKEDEDVEPFPLSKVDGKRKMGSSDHKADVKRAKTECQGKGKAKAEPDTEGLEEIADETTVGDVDIEDVLPSTKMKRIGSLLDLWHDVDPTQKTLIFCSFVEMLELMAVYLRKKGIKYVLYTGRMQLPERDEAIRSFQQSGDKTPTVMLISLKCGGVGLNLTAACNVIGLDLAWSPASEAQAVDRAHRITRPVTVKRLIVRDSVEQRILALQENKQMLADGAMGEGDGGRLGRLSAREILTLFGTEAGDD